MFFCKLFKFSKFLLVFFIIIYSEAKAEGSNLSCNSYSPLRNMFTDVCWSGMFPIRLAGITFMEGSSGVPRDAASSPMCACGGDIQNGKLPKIGFSLGFWAPSKIIDVTRKPYCFPSLSGTEMPLSSVDLINGGINLGKGLSHEAFANWVMYSAPLIYMLRLLDEGACPTDGVLDFDVLHTSAFFPNHNDVIGRYSVFVNPEMLYFSNVVAMMAMPIDAASASAGRPINELFWVGGSWGPIYPLTGFAGNGKMTDPVGFSSLIALRSISMLHRFGMLSETIGESNICRRNTRYLIRKDAYRWQMLAPSPEKDGSVSPASSVNSSNSVREVAPPQRYGTCTHPTGATTANWGMWRDVPATGEDHSYMLFQWTDCCFGMTPGSL